MYVSFNPLYNSVLVAANGSFPGSPSSAYIWTCIDKRFASKRVQEELGTIYYVLRAEILK